MTTPLFAPVQGTEHKEVGGVQVDVGQAGNGRIKRVIYQPGFRWSTHMKPHVGTEWCMHAHVGFLLQGEVHARYADGCEVAFKAPQVVAIEPGHDGWVEGNEPAVLVEVDFEGDTARHFGMPPTHRHGK